MAMYDFYSKAIEKNFFPILDLPEDPPEGSPSHYLKALEVLNQNYEWLKNRELVNKVLSRLNMIEPKNPEECLKTIAIFKKIKSFNQDLFPLEGTSKFQELLREMEYNSITISSLTGLERLVSVEIKADFQERQWNCLEKLHQFIPINHINFEGDTDKDLNKLLNFSKLNPNIISLSLGKSSNITDEYLEELSENLPIIKFFGIKSAKIKAIPEGISNRITDLFCEECFSLSIIKVPNVITLICNDCTDLETIIAPQAIIIDCRSCIALENITVPKLKELNCINCKKLAVPYRNSPIFKFFTCDNNFSKLKSRDLKEIILLGKFLENPTKFENKNNTTTFVPIIFLEILKREGIDSKKISDAIETSILDDISNNKLKYLLEIAYLFCKPILKSKCENHLCCSFLNYKPIDNSRIFSFDDEIRVNLFQTFQQIHIFNSSIIDVENLKNYIKENVFNVNIYLCLRCTPETLEDSLAIVNSCEPHTTVLELYSFNKPAIILNIKKLDNLSLKNCPNLIRISAPNVQQVYCNDSPKLEHIDAHDARILQFTCCPKLRTIDAPNVEDLNSSSCVALEKIYAPCVKKIKIADCISLTQIYAPIAIEIESFQTPNLKILYAPLAKSISLNNNRLKSIFAPHAKFLHISNNTELEAIYAPYVKTIQCYECINLTTIYAPKLQQICSANIPNSTKKTIILAPYKQLIAKEHSKPFLLNSLEDLFKYADLNLKSEQIDSFTGIVRIYVWLIQVSDLAVPLKIQSPKEQIAFNLQIEDSFKKLKSLAQEEMNISDIDLKWFNDIYEKINNPQHKIKTVIWLGEFLVRCSTLQKTPFLDKIAVNTLKTIALNTNNNTQTNITLSLISLYSPDNKELCETWKSNLKNLKSYQILPYLFLIHFKIENDLKILWINNLATRYYQSLEKINPITEVIHLVTEEKSLSIEDRQNILNLIFVAPVKNRERTADFRKRLNEFRDNQAKATLAAKNLILLQKFSELQNLQDINELLLKYKNALKEMFGLKEENIENFFTTFESLRCPRGLFIYAASLHNLEVRTRNVLIKELGLFVNSVIEGTFPESRYSFVKNEHLNAVFCNNQELLSKWKTPCKIKLNNIQDLNIQSTTPRDIVKKLITQAINDEHLGKNQKTLYPTLTSLIQEEKIEIIKSSIDKLTKDVEDLKIQIESVDLIQKAILENRLNRLSIEIFCLNLIILDVTNSTENIIHSLQKLIKHLKKGSQFESDIDDIINYITPSNAPELKYLHVEDCDFWEDLLLMGTEVKSSCQRIGGNPYLNMGLIATLIDGKNRLVIVRDYEGKIAGRVILRIMLNNNNEPVLFMERLYTRYNDPRLEKFILKGCIKKAKMMGIPLLAGFEWLKNIENQTPYPQMLTTLSGPASYEYSDGAGGMQRNGKYSISKSWLVYEKKV